MTITVQFYAPRWASRRRLRRIIDAANREIQTLNAIIGTADQHLTTLEQHEGRLVDSIPALRAENNAYRAMLGLPSRTYL